MIIYRPHRGTLAEAMLEAKEFDSIEAMKEYIVQENTKLLGKISFVAEDIVIDEESISDDRNGWNDTRRVCVRRMGDEDFMEKCGSPQCIGFCATDYPKMTAAARHDENWGMERLTFDGNFCDISQCAEVGFWPECKTDGCSQRKVWERLKHYEDLEEQGRLMVLPCAIGEKVYMLSPIDCENCQYYDGKTDMEHWLCNQDWCPQKIVEGEFDMTMLHRVGTRVFVTRAEAEATLTSISTNDVGHERS